jgi:hypothetical protein
MRKEPNDVAVVEWWNRLDDEEQDVLMALLYNMDLTELVEMDGDGRILSLKKGE